MSASPEDTKKQRALELYKMEYERASQRYNDIYNAIWTNFSYMAVVAGGILTFGSNRISFGWLLAAACTPLIFWCWATFWPMNMYGDKVVERLSWIEKIINQEFNLVTAPTQAESLEEHKGLRHYSEFNKRRKPVAANEQSVPRQLRVRYAVMIFAVLLHIGFFMGIGFGIKGGSFLHEDAQETKVNITNAKPIGVKVVESNSNR